MDEKTTTALLTGGGFLAASAVVQKLLEPWTRRREEERAQAKLLMEREIAAMEEARKLRAESTVMIDREKKRADDAEAECASVEKERDFWRETAQQFRQDLADYAAGCKATGSKCGQPVPVLKITPYVPAPKPDPKPAGPPAGEKGA